MSELAENAPVQEPVRKNKRRRRILIFCVVSLVNVGLLALLLTQLLTPARHAVPDPLVGHPAPDFSLAMLRPGSGKSSLSLSNFKGKPVVLTFRTQTVLASTFYRQTAPPTRLYWMRMGRLPLNTA